MANFLLQDIRFISLKTKAHHKRENEIDCMAALSFYDHLRGYLSFFKNVCISLTRHDAEEMVRQDGWHRPSNNRVMNEKMYITSLKPANILVNECKDNVDITTKANSGSSFNKRKQHDGRNVMLLVDIFLNEMAFAGFCSESCLMWYP